MAALYQKGWDETRAGLGILRASRPKVPAVSVPQRPASRAVGSSNRQGSPPLVLPRRHLLSSRNPPTLETRSKQGARNLTANWRGRSG